MSNKIISAKKITREIKKPKRKKSIKVNDLVIKFITDQSFAVGDIVLTKYSLAPKEYPFQVEKVEFSEDRTGAFVITAYETGYWASKLSRLGDLEVKYLIGNTVTKVTHEKSLEFIRETALWT